MKPVKFGKLSKRLPDPTIRVIMGILADSILLLVSYVIVYFVRETTTPPGIEQAAFFILFILIIMITSLYWLGVYRRIWARSSGHEINLILKSVGLATAITFTVDLLFRPRPLPLSVIVVANALTTGGFIAIRYRSRLMTGFKWRWNAVWKEEFPIASPKTRVLIIGAGESGQTLALRLKHRFPGHQYEIVGFVDDEPKKLGMYVEGCRVLGTRLDIVSIADAYRVDLIVVAIHNIPGSDFREILSTCEQTNALIKVMPNILTLVNSTNHSPLLRDVEPEDLIGRKPIARSAEIDFGPVTGKVVLVTGAAGSIGSELGRQIVDYVPTSIILLDNNESGLHDLTIEIQTRFPNVCVHPVLADVTDCEALQSIFKEHTPQVVFHAAAYKHVPMLEFYPHEAVRVNIGGTLCVAKLAGDLQVERFVLISTDKAVNPSSVMGASKRTCELILHALSVHGVYQTIFTSVRFGNVLGSRGSVLPTFSRQIDNEGPITVTDPEMTRYFMSIPEAVNLIIHAACLTKCDDIFMLNMGEEVSIVELAERMIRMRGLRPYKDIDIRFTGVRPGEKLHEELHSQSECPGDTVHPNIVRLNSWSTNFDTTLFFERLDELLKYRSGSRSEIFDVLRAIAQLENGRMVI